jgi:hypothetical protein
MLVSALLVGLAGLCAASPAAAARPIDTGFMIADGPVFSGTPAKERERWFKQARRDGARYVLRVATWRQIAPARKPAGFKGADPTSPGYRWAFIDNFVIDAKRRGLQPIIALSFAPSWAEGKNRPANAMPGVWKPSPKHLRNFARAAAFRYSGKFTDRFRGRLPRVKYFQAWTEANLQHHLRPVWRGRKPASPSIYRGLVSAVYKGVKSVHKSNKVLTAGTAPYGRPPGGAHMRPLQFWREVFCLKGRKALKPTKCKGKASFDILGHHPINTHGSPKSKPSHPDDVSSGNLASLNRVLRKARKARTIGRGSGKQLWATEFWFNTKPPAGVGVTPKQQARYIAESLYLFWRAGVRVALNLRIADPKGGGPVAGSGLYWENGSAKPGAHAFRFPFVGDRRSRKQINLWGKAPKSGRVIIQRKRGKGWKNVRRLKAGKNRVFAGKMRARGKLTLRAKSGKATSLPWAVR